MNDRNTYDIAIVGGGLAGLCLAIQMAKLHYRVILFEKESYPFHKVCGEYISMESWPFLQRLGVPLQDMQLPVIKQLLLTSPDGTSLQAALPLGGFGISRFTLDATLKDIATTAGVTVMERCKVNGIVFTEEMFIIDTTKGNFNANVCCGSYGKKSNLDVKWNRPFTRRQSRKLNQYAGIKYHIETDFAEDTIALHNFKNGYCGISKIEGNKYCLCYLTHMSNIRRSGQSIAAMEETILCENPHLKTILNSAIKINKEPVSIAQVSFLKKSQVEDHVLMLGDAAGMITPLCGNGMSMAMHASLLAAGEIGAFLAGKITRQTMEGNYTNIWQRNFAKRLSTGRMIQYFFGKKWITNLFIKTMKRFPALTRKIIKMTHGDPF